jgi:hypothetical protein
MTLLNFFNLGGGLGSVKFSLDHTVDNDPDYHFLGNYIQSPINNKVLHFHTNSGDHLWSATKKVSGRLSEDEFVTIPALFDIYDPTDGTMGVAEVGGGYSDNGRLHLFFYCRDNSDITLATNEIRYAYSDDDGATISTPASLTLPSDSLFGGWTTGRMIENDGVLLKNFYRINSGAANSANYLLRSTDGGSNWSTITIRASGTPYYNEADIIAVSRTELIILLRDEDNGGHQQYYSNDNGLTWTPQGNIQWGETWTVPRPCGLRSFRINNKLIIAAYHYLDATPPNNKAFVVYADALDLVSGTSGWNLNTKLTIFRPTINNGGYGNTVHFDNTLRAKGVHFEDESLASTNTLYYTAPTTHYDSLVTELGL